MLISDKKIFISHSSVDSFLHDEFMQLLLDGFQAKKSNIFSSLGNGIEIGEEYLKEIREAIRSADIIFFLMTAAFTRSHFCIAETGAAWMEKGDSDKTIIPILFEPVTGDFYSKIPLFTLQYIIPNTNDLMHLYQSLCERKDLDPRDMDTVQKNRETFSEKMNRFLKNIRFLPCRKGKYTATVLDDRRRTHNTIPEGKDCFLLSGLVPISEPPVEGETHWLFIDRKIHGQLQIGDVIKFELYLPDTLYPYDNTRNIYPTNHKIEVLNRPFRFAL